MPSDNSNNRGTTDVNYTAVTFDEIKQKLINRAKTYYPDTYRDFGRASFGSLMFDMVAMVGEQLNFYAQFLSQESFAEFSRTNFSLVQGAERAGVDTGTSAPVGYLIGTFPVLPNSTFTGPDKNIKYIINNIKVAGPAGLIATNLEPISIDPEMLEEELVETVYTEDGSRPLVYMARVQFAAIIGETNTITATVTSYDKYLKVETPEPAETVSNVLNCVTSEGDIFFEVPNLVHDTIWRSVDVQRSGDPYATARIVPFPVPRRFQVITEAGKKKLLFGYGSEDTLKKINAPANLADLLLERESKQYVKDNTVLPEKWIQSDKFGVAPQNTTLTIEYRLSSVDNSNAAANTLNRVLSTDISFDNEEYVGESNMQFIKTNISVTNDEPFNGEVQYTSTKDIALAIKAAQGAQSRAVTPRDFIAMSYKMPNKFGKVTKVSIYRDTNGLKKNINLYCISQGRDGMLQKPSTLLKENLRTWLSAAKMMSDTIDIFDAEILNIGLFLDVTIKSTESKSEALPRIREFLFNRLTLAKPEIGGHFSMGEVRSILYLMPIIQSVNEVKVLIKSGRNYSSTRYDVPSNISPDKNLLYIPENFIWEIKNQSDITGKIQ